MHRDFGRVDESRQSSVIQSATARELLRAVLCRVAVPAIKSTGGRYNYSVARNSLRGEAAPAGRLGSDIAVQPPAAFRWLPGNVRRLDNAGQIAPRPRRHSSVSIRRLGRVPTHGVCNRLNAERTLHDALRARTTDRWLDRMQRTIGSYS
jgi:hypothetical protein